MHQFIEQICYIFTLKERLKFFLIVIFMSFSALLELVSLGILYAVAAALFAPSSTTGEKFFYYFNMFFPQISFIYQAAVAILLIGVLLVIKNFFAFWVIRIQSDFIYTKRKELSRKLFTTYVCADYESFSQLSPDYCQNSFQRLTAVSDAILLPLMQVHTDVLLILFLTTASLSFFPAIVLGAVGFMLVMAWVTAMLYRNKNSKYGNKIIEKEQLEYHLRYTGIFGKKTLNSIGKEKIFIHRFSEISTEVNNIRQKLYILGQIPRIMLESAAIILACCVFLIMVLLEIPLAEILITFAVLTAVIGRILPAASRCHYNLTLICQNKPLLQVVCHDLCALKQESEPSGVSADASKSIKINNVSFVYKNGISVFHGLDLTISPGMALAVIGTSGIGKSTLVDLILGFLTPCEGKITAGNIPICNNLPAWRKQIGLVPQHIFLTEGTVAENIALGEDNINTIKVKNVLKKSGLKDWTPDRRINGQDNLSGGQRQRLGIARALYNDVKLLILDEATSALDTMTENEICGMLKELKGQITIIIVTHRKAVQDICDCTLDLAELVKHAEKDK